MSTPTETSPTTRKRTLGIVLSDEEQGLGHDAPAPKVLSPGTESSRRRRLQDSLTQHLRFEENKEELIKFWDQFTRKGKKKVGVVESFRALLFSSCRLSLNDGGVQCELNLVYFIHQGSTSF
jgi:Ca2+:H+ antiporter